MENDFGLTCLFDQSLKHVDLCAGTGAFTLVMEEELGARCVFANDNCKKSKLIYDANFSHPLTFGDLNEIDIEDIPECDILTAGFPCNPWSTKGLRKGFADSRSQVFFTLVSILKLRQPRFAIFENVKGLLNHEEGASFQKMMDVIEEAGYVVKWTLVNTDVHTVIPQNRERVFIFCFKNTADAKKVSLDIERVRESRHFMTFTEETVDEKYYMDRSKLFPTFVAGMTEVDYLYQWSRNKVVKKQFGKCPCLLAAMGTGGLNVPMFKTSENRVRKLTPRECFNLQGFPDYYNLPDNVPMTALYKLAGNAVTVEIVRLLVRKLELE